MEGSIIINYLFQPLFCGLSLCYNVGMFTGDWTSTTQVGRLSLNQWPLDLKFNSHCTPHFNFCPTAQICYRESLLLVSLRNSAGVIQVKAFTKSLVHLMNILTHIPEKMRKPERGLSCMDPGIFVRGGPGRTARKKPGRVFFFFVFVLSLFCSLKRGSNGFIT